MKVICRVQWLLMVIMFISGGCDGQLTEDNTFFHFLKDLASKIVGRTTSEPRLLQEAVRNNKIQDKIPESTDFPCRFIGPNEAAKTKIQNGRFQQVSSDVDISQLPRARSEVRPTSVHSLRPGDFDITAAMGDSVTAANGAAASNILHILSENRGVSWSNGGQGTWREYLTLPNILKVFNPNLIGFSLSDASGHHRAAQFNVAEMGAMSRDMPYMAKVLVTRLTKDRRVNLKMDWKLITLLISPNDFCLDVCYQNSPQEIPSKHRKELMEALLILKKNLPRTFVNLIPAPDVNQLFKRLKGKPPLCHLTHRSECPCLFGEPMKHKYKETINIIKRWQQIDLDIENAPELNDQDDFTVVVQPFILDIMFPDGADGNTDFSFLSVDCFHFSQKGYSWAANSIWNNMLQPPGKKQSSMERAFKTFMCPTAEFPFIYTLKNSKGFTNSTSHFNLSQNDNTEIYE